MLYRFENIEKSYGPHDVLRGVTWQHQDRVAEGVQFSCTVPNRHNPDITRLYRATAGDYDAAVRAVLQQIDAES